MRLTLIAMLDVSPLLLAYGLTGKCGVSEVERSLRDWHFPSLSCRSATLGFGLISLVLSATFVVTGVLFDQHYFSTGTMVPTAPKPPHAPMWWLRQCDIRQAILPSRTIFSWSCPGLHTEKKAPCPATKLAVRACPQKRNSAAIRIAGITLSWLIASLLLTITLYGLYGVVRHDGYLTHTQGVLYATFSRFGWSLGLAWVIFACHLGFGSWVYVPSKLCFISRCLPCSCSVAQRETSTFRPVFEFARTDNLKVFHRHKKQTEHIQGRSWVWCRGGLFGGPGFLLRKTFPF